MTTTRIKVPAANAKGEVLLPLEWIEVDAQHWRDGIYCFPHPQIAHRPFRLWRPGDTSYLGVRRTKEEATELGWWRDT